jgi:truncated hemoglobin YjbI
VDFVDIFWIGGRMMEKKKARPSPATAEQPQEDTTTETSAVDAWLERYTEAMRKMYLDEEYRKEVAKRIS